jgi:uncharacterized protein (TIGR02001 family)
MRWIFTGVTGALLLAAQGVHADASVTLTGVTDYDFRGISQSDGDSAIQGSFDYSGEHFYASAWASTIDFKGEQTYPDGSTETVRYDGKAELDLVAGFAGETEGGWRWDAGLTYYLYPGSNDDIGNPLDDNDDTSDTPNYAELYVGGGFTLMEWLSVDAKYWYSPDLYDSGDTASYFEINPSVSLPWDLSLNLHGGYSFGDYFDTLSDDAEADGSSDDADYYDYGIGLGRSFGHFDFELKYVGTVTDTYFEVDKGILRNDERVILSVATTLPWAKDEE